MVCLAFGFGCLLHHTIDQLTGLGLDVVGFAPTATSSTRGKDERIRSNSDNHKGYAPSTCEKYIVDHAEELGYASLTNPSGCTIWKDIKATNEEIYNQLQSYSSDLDNYNEAVRNFEPISDMMIGIKGGNYDVCSSAKLHPDGLIGLFPSKQLSLTKSGYIEPLTAPMCSHKYCHNKSIANLMLLDYLVHDYETMCRNLKPTSKRVLFDLGTTLDLGRTNGLPVMQKLMDEYEKFGFRFDHIYAFEITPKNTTHLFKKLLPDKYFAAYHWINVGKIQHFSVFVMVIILLDTAAHLFAIAYSFEGVSSERGDKMNPINSILAKFDEDNFIVFKLDIDKASIEIPLAQQLLNGGTNGIYHRLVDQFYFEHHVHIKEMRPFWGLQKNGKVHWNGTIKDSLDLFHGLRSKGVPAHFWP